MRDTVGQVPIPALDPKNIPSVLHWGAENVVTLLEYLLAEVAQEQARASGAEYQHGLEAGQDKTAEWIGRAGTDDDVMVTLNGLLMDLRLIQTMTNGRGEYRRGVVYVIRHVDALLYAEADGTRTAG